MNPNSTVKIYAEFTFRVLNNETWDLNPQILTSLDDPNTNQTNLIIDANPSSFKGNKSHVNVTYTITSKGNTKGVYALFLYYCGLSQLVVGFNESEVSPAFYDKFFTASYMCPAGSEYMPDMNIIGFSGIVSKNITINANNTTTVTSVNQLGELPKSPLKQLKVGVKLSEIKCRKDFILVTKNEDNSPACVTPSTALKLIERGWTKETITNTKNNDPFGITALVIYHPHLGCLGPCPPNDFYLKINSNSSAYLMGYNICDGNSCAKNDTISVLLPINKILSPDYATVWLPVDLQWKYGDTVQIQVKVASTPDSKTAKLIDLGESKIVP